MSSDILPPLPSIPNVEVRHIPDFLGYAVGADGSVWSCKNPGRWQPSYKPYWGLLSQHYKPERLSVTLWRKNKQYNFFVSRLVLHTFIGPCPEGMEACHTNSDFSDNRLCNLRWDTHVNNEKDKIGNGTAPIGENNSASKLSQSDVLHIRQLALQGKTQAHIAAIYGIKRESVRDIIHSKLWKHIETIDSQYTPQTAKGERNSKAKMTQDSVRAIRELASQGVPTISIAKQFHIDKSQVNRIVSRKHWKHAP